jgi:hypothetical protein
MVGDGNLFLFPGSSHYLPPPCGKKEVPARVEGGENPAGKHAGTHATRESTHQSQTRISSPCTLTSHLSGVVTSVESIYINVTVYCMYSQPHTSTSFSVYYPAWEFSLKRNRKITSNSKKLTFIISYVSPWKDN